MVRAATGKTPGKSGNHHNGKTDIFKSGIVILIFVVGMLGYYYYLSNRASRVTEENVKLTVAQETLPIQGGFILRSGNVEVNCTFDTLVRLQKAETAGAVAKKLFPEA